MENGGKKTTSRPDNPNRGGAISKESNSGGIGVDVRLGERSSEGEEESQIQLQIKVQKVRGQETEPFRLQKNKPHNNIKKAGGKKKKSWVHGRRTRARRRGIGIFREKDFQERVDQPAANKKRTALAVV